MNPLQDAICDRLVGTAISRDWVNGPLHIAAEVIDPNFVLAPGRYTWRPNQLIRTLNWPRLFCLAFHGANAALVKEDRLALALAVFQKVVPGTKQKRVPLQRTCEIACWMALRVHPLACAGPCPLHQAMTDLVKDFQAGTTLTFGRRRACEGSLRECPRYSGSPRAAVKPNSSPAHHSVVAYRYLLYALTGNQTAHMCADAAREAARTEAKVRGVQGAIEICLELSSQLKL